MFELERAVAEWRASVARELGDRPDVLDELEAHLHDEFDRQRAGGRTETDAWAEAVARLGDAELLAAEFAKSTRAAWMPERVAVLALFACLVALTWMVVHRLAVGRVGVLLAAHVLTLSTGYLAVIALGLLANWTVLAAAITRRPMTAAHQAALQRVGYRLATAATAMTVTGIVLGACWARQHLGFWWGWSAVEVGGLCIALVAALLVCCFRSRRASPMSRLVMACLGNVVVCVGCLGSQLVRSGPNGMQPSLSGGLIAAFVMTQLLVIYGAMAPRLLRQAEQPIL